MSDVHHVSSALTRKRWVLRGASFAPKPFSIICVSASRSSNPAIVHSKRLGERIAMILTISADCKSSRKSTFQCKVFPCLGNRFPFPKPHSANWFIIFSRIACGGLLLLRVACRMSRRANEVAPFSESAEPTYV